MFSSLPIFVVFLCRLLLVSSLPKDDATTAQETWIGRALWENDEPGQLTSKDFVISNENKRDFVATHFGMSQTFTKGNLIQNK